MPKDIPFFLINGRWNQDFVNKIPKFGVHAYNYVVVSESTHYLITEHTVLRSTYETSGDLFIFKLFFNEIEISETIMHEGTYFAEIETIVKNLDALPKSLLKSAEILEKERLLEENTPDIILPIGKNKPEERLMALLDCFCAVIDFDEKEKQFFIKLPKQEGFSYSKKHDVKAAFPRTEYDVKFNGEKFATIYEDHMFNDCQFRLHVNEIEKQLNILLQTAPLTASAADPTLGKAVSEPDNASLERKVEYGNRQACAVGPFFQSTSTTTQMLREDSVMDAKPVESDSVVREDMVTARRGFCSIL